MKSFRLAFSCFVLILVGYQNACAQSPVVNRNVPSIIHGHVTDSAGNGYVRHAEIRIAGSDTVIYTDDRGYFKAFLWNTSDTIIVTSASLGSVTTVVAWPEGSGGDLTIKLPGSCKNIPVTDICPKCHSKEHVLKIIYGMPNDALMKKYEDGLVWLGGCMVDDCMPHYYCKDDKIEF